MSGRLMWAAIFLILAFAVAQLIRPRLTNPPIDKGRTIQAQMATASGLGDVLDRSCGDCHSYRTVWPWYAHVAPVSWLMAYGVAEGRKAVNFSDWAAYSPQQRRRLLDQVCKDVSEGKMPGSAWTTLHPEARLSAQDIQTICATVHQAEAVAVK